LRVQAVPTYVYECKTCGEFEKWQSFSENALAVCPTCGGAVRRLITPAPIVFKGSGWYSTDKAGSSSKTVGTSGEKKSDTVATNGAEKKSETPAASEAPAPASE